MARGTPFHFEGFVGGLNSIANPYEVQSNEARELMNVVSTERGSIKKRNGSTIFASGASVVFPSLAATDTFKRKEKPLSNAGKWTAIPGTTNSGELNEAEHWQPEGKVTSGSRWNVAEQANPAVSVEVFEVSKKAYSLWACLTVSGENGYRLRVLGESITLQLKKEGIISSLATVTHAIVAKDSIGLGVRNGIVSAWIKHGGTWSKLAEAADATFTTGYGGIEASNSPLAPVGSVELNNFAIGEFEGSAAEVELVSLFPVTISGTRYLIASGGTELFSINEAGEITEIGKGFTSGLKWSICQANKGTLLTAGPAYLTNGTDKAQYWTGVAKGTKVAEWKGAEATTERTDGVLKEATITLTSKTAAFLPTDISLIVTFVTEVKQKTEEKVIKTARVVSRPSAEEVVVEIDPAGWLKEYTAVKFKVERSYYKSPGVPQGKYMIFANERVWMTGIEGDTSAVRFSELTPIGEGGEQPDPTAWPSPNVVRFDPEDGNPITGIGTVGPYILVFKKNKTWIIHNAAPIATRKLSHNIGCVSHRSIVETPHGTYFLTAEQGIYLTNGSSLTEMSYKVRPTILNINPAKAENAAGAYFNNHYYLSFASGTNATPNRTLDYDVVLTSWWLHDLTGNQWANYESVAGEPFLYAIPPKAKAGVVKCFVPNVFTDSGKNYTGNETLGAFWLGAWEPFYYFIFRHRVKAPHLKKRVRAVFFNGEGQIIPGVYKNFQLAERQEPAVVGAEEIATKDMLPVNFTGSTAQWGEGEGVWGTGEGFWGGEATIGAARMYSLGVGFVWSVGWGNNSNEPFTVDGFTILAQFRKS